MLILFIAAASATTPDPIQLMAARQRLQGEPELDPTAASVVTGPGPFVIPVLKWEDFPVAVRQKLVLEIAGKQPDLNPLHRVEGYDCLIGEKIWRQRRLDWGDDL